MRVPSWMMVAPALAVGMLTASDGQVQAGPLNPFDFASLGAFLRAGVLRLQHQRHPHVDWAGRRHN